MLTFSVLMSVYHCDDPKNLRESLQSIWDNQIYRPDEIVLVQDGPLSQALEQVINEYRYKLGDKFVSPKLKMNQGLASALNFGLQYCTHNWVARMDADDISLPDRFEKQIDFLSKHPNITALGTQVSEWDDSMTKEIAKKTLPTTPDELYSLISWRCPLNHPSVILRKDAVLAVGGYPESYPEDWPLWGMLLAKNFQIANLDTVGVKMRVENALLKRRGYRLLRGELKTLRLFHSLGLINTYLLIRNSLLRILLRTTPHCLRQWLYRHFR